MLNHSCAQRPVDRTFRHFLPLEGRIHIVEVQRLEGLYKATAFLGPQFYPQDKGHDKVKYPVVALSIGNGFSTLHDAIRSLRKDLGFEAWARASIKARVGKVLAEAEESAWDLPRIAP